MVAVRQQILSRHILGRFQLAVGKQRRRLDDLGRQVRQLDDVFARHGGVGRIAGHGVELGQHRPALRQGRIDMDGDQQRLDGLVGILALDEAQAAFLM